MAVNYFAGFNPDVLDPNKALVNSLDQGITLQNNQLVLDQNRQKLEFEKQKQALELQRQQKKATDLAHLYSGSATIEDQARYIQQYPEDYEASTAAYKNLSEARQKNLLHTGSRVVAALDNGNPVLAKQVLTQTMEALKNGNGDPQDLHFVETMLEGLESGQEASVKGMLQTTLALSVPDFMQRYTGMNKDAREGELQPYVVNKTEADADKARVEADNAQDVIDVELENKRAGTDKTRADIANAEQITDATVRNTNSLIDDREFQQQKKTFVTGGDGRNYIFGANGTLSEALDSQGQQIGTVKKLSDAANLKMVELMATNDAADIAKGKLQKALQLNKTAYKGAGAEFLATVRNNIMGGSQESQDTLEYQNLVTGQALESLKATFGAAPTEGERAMLLKLQASVNYPREVRARILGEALSTIDKKKASNERQMKTVIGSAKPYSQGGDASTGNTGSTVPVGRTMSMADARIAASKAGMSIPQAIAKLKAQGITVQ